MVDNIFALSLAVVIKRMLLPNLLSQDQVFWKVTPIGCMLWPKSSWGPWTLAPV